MPRLLEVRAEVVERRGQEVRDIMLGRLPCQDCSLYQSPDLTIELETISRGSEYLSGREDRSTYDATVVGTCNAVERPILGSRLPARQTEMSTSALLNNAGKVDLPEGCPVAEAYKSAVSCDTNTPSISIPEFVFPLR